ncbi:MAG: hypothetical protein M2R45_04479 [Verrucomicrobia subdivision 3 bacterium]|nr:hypothetical protein [Limisphaerales bacterium]MCS1412678.1 hypothetical protein [Limisphaerales bacterium]
MTRLLVLIIISAFFLNFKTTASDGSLTPIISEFVASNNAGITDEDQESSDWIELWNPTEDACTLTGFFLTDDIADLKKWTIPPITIPPNEYHVIFASGKDRTNPQTTLHTNFRLQKSDGGCLMLTQETAQGLETVSAYRDYPRQRTDISFGINESEPSAKPKFFKRPTPGARNRGASLEGLVADTQFSVNRGFFSQPFETVITTSTPGATIVYTTDGTVPSPKNGIQIAPANSQTAPAGDIIISDTTTLRAMAFRDGFESTNVDTQTYLFPSKVLQQDNSPPLLSTAAQWGHAGPDWAMDPEIVQHNDPEIRPEASDLLGLATVSLVMDFDNMFGPRGIYIAGQSLEKDTSVEFVDPAVEPDGAVTVAASFQEDSTVQIVGGSSPNRWKSDKLSMRLKFQPDLRFPVFGDQATDRFDTLVLDARLNNVWHYGGGVEPNGQRERAQYVRDQYTANLHNELGGHSPHGRHVHVYLNGIYWGIHTLHERPDDNFAASYLGGANTDYDAIKHQPNDVLQGSPENYRQLHSLADRLRSDHSLYSTVTTLLDIPDFTAYMLVNYYIGNTDWAHHNWYASYNRAAPEGRWRFHSWDAEKGLHRVTDDLTGRNDKGGPTNLHHDLMRHPEYRLQFADRAYDALRYGVLSPAQTRQAYLNVSDPIDLATRVESARWGDNQRQRPYTRLDWLKTRDDLLGTGGNNSSPLRDYFNRRSDIVIDQFKRQGWLPSQEPPTFNQHGGFVAKGFSATIRSSSPGTIYYTTDASDPRVPGQPGQINTVELVAETTTKRALMPTDDSLRNKWFRPDFDDSAWPAGTRGAGYENGTGYQEFLDPKFDFKDRVQSSANESIYLRAAFEIDGEPNFDQLTLQIRYDDGFIAYLNGHEVARANAPGTRGQPLSWNSSATTTHSDGEATQLISLDLPTNTDSLRNGPNILAIHGLNSGASSSDFLIWPTLFASRTQGGSSSSLSTTAKPYNGPITIDKPTRVMARSRNGNEWSPLLQAEFLANTIPASSENLIISRIHYHPSPPTDGETRAGYTSRSDFEFLELANLTSQFVHLVGVKFGDGIQFQFTESSPLRNLPGNGRLIIAANPDAYQARHRTSLPVLGPFGDGTRLSNSGERITLLDTSTQVISSLTYDDRTPWPTLTDGQGYALALRKLKAGLDLNQAANWLAIPVDITPSENLPESAFRYWLTLHFSEGAINTGSITGFNADPDRDGIDNLREYFHGTDPQTPNEPTGILRISVNHETAGITLKFTHSPTIEPNLWTIESSIDLLTWNPLTLDNRLATQTNADQTQSNRLSLPSEAARQFFRLRIESPQL